MSRTAQAQDWDQFYPESSVRPQFMLFNWCRLLSNRPVTQDNDLTLFPREATGHGILEAGTPPTGTPANLGVNPGCSATLGQ